MTDILPVSDCYRWPAEWEPHAATWVAWPVSQATWPGIFERIPPAYAALVAAIARFESVRVLAGGKGVAAAARPLIDAACEAAGSDFSVDLIDIPVNDSWCRDHGPIFLNGKPQTAAAGQLLILDFEYNAWGGKYPPWDLDARVAGRIADLLQIPAVRPGLILEGGAIEGNGGGTILTTESCLLNPNRNPHLTRPDMEAVLKSYLKADRVIWLPGYGIVGDDTDGHIDQVARFVDARRVLVAAPYEQDAAEAADLRANHDAIAGAVNAAGDSLIPVPLPLPAPKFQQGQRLPASYCNYCLVNGGVIVPLFHDPADDAALRQLQECHPDRTVVGVDALDLVWGLGACHCMTQQQPL